MQALRDWSFARVLLVSVGWVVVSVALIALWIFLALTWSAGISSGSAGIGAVSVGISEAVLAIPVLPPIVLTVVWTIVRRSRR